MWSPDGEWIYFQSDRGDSYDLFRVAADGSEQPVQLTENDADEQPSSVSPDGKLLVYSQITEANDWDVMIMPLDGEGETRVFLSTPFIEYGGKVSPDGKWLVYGSNESGGFETYVRPFPSGRGEWKISSNPRAAYPTWSNEGDEIFFRTATGVAAAAVEIDGDSFRAKRPEVLFEGAFIDLFPSWDYDAAPGGDSFVMLQVLGSGGDNKVDHVVLVINWFAELEQTFATAP